MKMTFLHIPDGDEDVSIRADLIAGFLIEKDREEFKLLLVMTNDVEDGQLLDTYKMRKEARSARDKLILKLAGPGTHVYWKSKEEGNDND